MTSPAGFGLNPAAIGALPAARGGLDGASAPTNPLLDAAEAEAEVAAAFVRCLLNDPQAEEEALVPSHSATPSTSSTSVAVHKRLVVERQRMLQKRLSSRKTTPLHMPVPVAADQKDV